MMEYRDGEARREFLEAIRQRPSSILARAFLGITYVGDLDWDAAARISAEIETLPAEQPEDLFFKGDLIGLWDAERAIQLMDQAAGHRPMAYTYLPRSEARSSWASETGDLDAVERSLEEAATARQLFPGMPRPISTSLDAEFSAAIVYGFHGLEEKKRASLARTNQYLTQLKKFPEVRDGIFFRCTFAEYAAFDEKKPIVIPADLAAQRQQWDAPFLALFQALMDFRVGRDADALRALGDPATNSQNDLLRVMILLGTPGARERVNSYLEDWARDSSSEYKSYALYWIRLGLGEGARGVAELQWKRDHGWRVPPRARGHDRAFMEFYCSQDPDQEARLLAAVAGVKSSEAKAHFAIAMRLLGLGRRRDAAMEFRKVGETYATNTHAWDLAVTILARMDADPAWPTWAPANP
jgi:hypothetical protein